VKSFVRGLFLFTLGLLAGATLVDRMRERTSERTRRMFVAMDVQRAKDLAARGDLAGAKEAWIRANLLHPDSFEAHLGLGFFHECAGEWDNARRQYERAIEVYPKAAGVDLHAPQPDDLALAHARLGRAAKRAGDERASRRAFEGATSIGASARAKSGPALPDSEQAWLDFLARLDRHCPERPEAPAPDPGRRGSAPSDPSPGDTE
jgi:tetratricopeptide (TPR) repeat protein